MIPFELLILGAGSAIPTKQRAASSQLLKYGGTHILIDCAEGTQMLLQKYHVSPMRINAVFISHLHGDHYFGLIGLISSMHLQGRTKSLQIFGPPQLIEIIRMQLAASATELRYVIHFHSLEKREKQLIYHDDQLNYYAFPVKHRIPTWGFQIEEQKSEPHLRKDFAEKYQPDPAVIKLIKKGAGYHTADGTFLSHQSITFPSGKPRSYSYCTDTAYDEELIKFVQGTNLLYHEATFMAHLEAEAAQTYHSTTIQAATIAKKAQVKKLLIGHFSSRYSDVSPLLEEAVSVFPDTALAIDGSKHLIG
jgi:ribonuclease Z